MVLSQRWGSKSVTYAYPKSVVYFWIWNGTCKYKHSQGQIITDKLYASIHIHILVAHQMCLLKWNGGCLNRWGKKSVDMPSMGVYAWHMTKGIFRAYTRNMTLVCIPSHLSQKDDSHIPGICLRVPPLPGRFGSFEEYSRHMTQTNGGLVRTGNIPVIWPLSFRRLWAVFSITPGIWLSYSPKRLLTSFYEERNMTGICLPLPRGT